MSSRLTRPRRTKMYDCNYRMGERNYRPVLDDLDRKYSGRLGSGGEGGLSSLRGALAEAEATLPTRHRSATPDAASERRRPLSSLLDDDDSFFDVASRKAASRRQALLKMEDGFDEDLESTSSRRVRDSRKRIAALEEELAAGRRGGGSGSDFADKVLDSVGLSGEDVSKARQYLQRRKVTISSSAASMGDEDDAATTKALTQWTKLDRELDVGGGSSSGGAAAARARKSRARLQDIENEMEELADRAAARERRSANVRALLQETADVGTTASTSSTLRVRKVQASSTAEKTVSF